MLTTREVELKIARHGKYLQNIVIPRVQGSYKYLGFETDMLSITKSGYATGYEIKVSAGDLRRDLKKPHLMAVITDQQSGLNQYYKRLKYFYYVVPKKLLPLAESIVPGCFGLLYVNEDNRICCHRWPERLFNFKWDQSMILHMAHLGCMKLYHK
ncbi:hypothetical protein [Arachidicoccus terrestris]|uniref:hypothetical protein n=1 Tax=Arachidicoccus terrestris TaxID=2875539 RepID=UPI001CC6C4F4|nr:hypothetical protein [Arachidicoccus terrestris]UAY56242.1 hypothetical protein K9M52_04280 [Arachidicoccus terrestris]